MDITLKYDKKNPKSIAEYASHLVGKTFYDIIEHAEKNETTLDERVKMHGMIYYIVEGKAYGDPVDKETYEAWHNDLVGGAEVINVPYVSFTPENIAAVFG